jgi:hypothetical protein
METSCPISPNLINFGEMGITCPISPKSYCVFIKLIGFGEMGQNISISPKRSHPRITSFGEIGFDEIEIDLYCLTSPKSCCVFIKLDSAKWEYLVPFRRI